MPRDRVEDCTALDVWELARDRPLTPGRVGTSRWMRGGVEVGRITWVVRPDALRVFYRSGEPAVRDDAVPLLRTPASFGGELVWFACPGCSARVRILYLPPSGRRFLCRRCHNLGYASQATSRRQRALERARRESWRPELDCAPESATPRIAYPLSGLSDSNTSMSGGSETLKPHDGHNR